jgi:hypothetical protein
MLVSSFGSVVVAIVLWLAVSLNRRVGRHVTIGLVFMAGWIAFASFYKRPSVTARWTPLIPSTMPTE